MKMVKSLLLGTAAGLVAMTGAQAADLPVKAKPVQYVKICSLYGAGFYYIPGTDTCIKVGGWVRMQMMEGMNGNSTNGPMATNTANRLTTDFSTRNRGYITADARSQTEYGTLRSYIAVGVSGDNAGNATLGTNPVANAPSATQPFSSNRAFIQFAGFTAGKAQSFYDSMNYSAVSYFGGSAWTPGGADTGDGGKQVLAYTAQLGNGISASISAEDKRRGGTYIPNSTTTTSTTVGGPVGDKMPDFVGNLRVDQAWGNAQVMGAVHDASATYYDIALAGHPSNAFGYAIGAGIRVNAPMLGAGDYVQAQFNWTKGAIGYAAGTSNLSKTNGGTSGFGLMTDGVYSATAGSNIELTTAWSVGASFEHNWNSKWKTSAYGGYTLVDYSDVANALFGAATNQDFKTWQVGTRTAWAPVNNLEVGLDVMYTKLQSANSGVVATSQDQSAWVGNLRIQRNFYP